MKSNTTQRTIYTCHCSLSHNESEMPYDNGQLNCIAAIFVCLYFYSINIIQIFSYYMISSTSAPEGPASE